MHGKLTALVDGDILLYRSAAACAQNTYRYVKRGESNVPLEFKYVSEAREALGKDITSYIRTKSTVLQPPENCLYSIKNTIKKILAETSAQDMKIYIGGKDNYRDVLTDDYKAGRPPKPAYYQLARDYLVEFCGAEIVDGQEVDDKLAQEQGHSTVICSIDKDLLQVPGAHYNWVKSEWTYISKEEGDEWFWIQMLVGDTVDNIKGIPDIGMIKATQLVQMFDGNLKRVRAYVQMVYLEHYDMPQFMLNAQLLYIRRSPDHVAAPRIFMEVV